MAVFDRFPGGRRKALTLSYDDGVVQDRRLVGILNRHGIKGTFHLNSGLLGQGRRLAATEVASLFEGHEVSAHGVVHACLPHLTGSAIVNEVFGDRRALEDLVGVPVRGMSFAGGDFDRRVLDLLPSLGIEYARTTLTRPDFGLPEDPLQWAASCHHRQCAKRGDAFLAVSEHWGLQLMYVWGHSYEFDNPDSWDLIETFCERLGGRDEIWYATNIEVVDYMAAVRSIRGSASGGVLLNPSAQRVWFTDRSSGEGHCASIGPGETLQLGTRGG